MEIGGELPVEIGRDGRRSGEAHIAQMEDGGEQLAHACPTMATHDGNMRWQHAMARSEKKRAPEWLRSEPDGTKQHSSEGLRRHPTACDGMRRRAKE